MLRTASLMYRGAWMLAVVSGVVVAFVAAGTCNGSDPLCGSGSGLLGIVLGFAVVYVGSVVALVLALVERRTLRRRLGADARVPGLGIVIVSGVTVALPVLIVVAALGFAT